MKGAYVGHVSTTSVTSIPVEFPREMPVTWTLNLAAAAPAIDRARKKRATGRGAPRSLRRPNRRSCPNRRPAAEVGGRPLAGRPRRSTLQ